MVEQAGKPMGAFDVLNQNKDFRTLYYRGKSKVHPLLVTYVRKSKIGFTRVGITTGKKVGKAVQRNRSRRIIRAAYQQLMPQVSGHWDIVFVARSKTAGSTSKDIARVMEGQLQELGVLGPGGRK